MTDDQRTELMRDLAAVLCKYPSGTVAGNRLKVTDLLTMAASIYLTTADAPYSREQIDEMTARALRAFDGDQPTGDL